MKYDFKDLVTIDMETFYSAKYSLRAKLFNTSSYIMDEQFQMHCCAIKIGTAKSKCYWGRDQIEAALSLIDWSCHDMLAHNNFFDGAISKWHLGIKPRRRFCTLQMTRGLHSDMSKGSLQAICEFYGIPGKTEGLEDVKGMRTEDIPLDKRKKLMAYCINDNEKCFQVFKKQIAAYPEDEIDLIDLTLSMYVDHVFKLDVPRAEKSMDYEMNERLKFIAMSGHDEKTLTSTPKFVAALEALGVTAPCKVSKYNGEVSYALAETDADFVILQEHEDMRVVRLVQGRLAAKSTMMETRAWRMLQAQERCGGLPVMLNYCGAKTTRWSGADKTNYQNIPKSSKDYPLGGELRYSILAPAGHVIFAPDSAQIEARVLAWLAGNDELLERFRNKEDVYKWMASLIYNCTVEEVDNARRQIGKIAILGLGYSMGPKRFQTTLALGIMGPPMLLSAIECAKIVKMYRKINATIVTFWKECEDVLEQMCQGKAGSFGPGGLLEYEGTSIWLPNGLGLHYPGLKMTWDTEKNRRSGFSYNALGIKKHIYGGLLCENLTQALASVVIREEMNAVERLYKPLRPKLKKGEKCQIATMTHDEIVSVVPLRLAPKLLKQNLEIMRTPPKWAPDMPIWAAADDGFAVNYSV